MKKRQFQERYRELAPIIYYGEMERGVQISALSDRPDGKFYVHCIDMSGIGELQVIICVTDGCVDCFSETDFSDAESRIESILEYVLERGAKIDRYVRYREEKENGNWPMQMPLDERLTSGFIEAYIPSIDTAAYLRSVNHHFSEMERATIIANHECLSVVEKLEALRRMEELTEDEELRGRLRQAQKLVEDDPYQRTDAAWGAFHDFFFIPHDYRHGDIVRFVGANDRRLAGIILKYGEQQYEFYRNIGNIGGDYSDVQVTVDTPFLIEGYGHYLPIYHYLGGFSHEHVNPIYIERARLGENDLFEHYMDYLAACGTPGEEQARLSATLIVEEEIERVRKHYPGLNLMELLIKAAKACSLYRGQTPVKELLGHSKIKLEDIEDYELMDGLFQLMPEDVIRSIQSE